MKWANAVAGAAREGMRCRKALCIAMIATGLAAVAIGAPAQPVVALAADANEEIVRVPVIVNGKETGNTMVTTVYRPDGAGPFPLVLLHHGRAGSVSERARAGRYRFVPQARYLVKKGFAVMLATRRGYGETGGRDVETSYQCSNPGFASAVEGAVESALSVLEYARKQPYVDATRVLAMGVSVGGLTSIGLAGAAPAGLLGAISIAGGHGGRPETNPGNPCGPAKLGEVFAELGKTAKVPTLWVYAENDSYFGPEVARAWHAAFIGSGGRGELQVLPPFGQDGHRMFTDAGMRVWMPIADEFMRSLGF